MLISKISLNQESLESIQYPIGKPKIPELITSDHLKEWIHILETFPKQLSDLVDKLTPEQLDTPYRDHGWTIRYVLFIIYLTVTIIAIRDLNWP